MVCLDLKQSSSVAEYLVICTSKSQRHGKSLAQNVIENHPKGCDKPKIEGDDFAEWILLDCGHTIVHIMLAPVRSYYNLEKLWDHPTNHS